VLPCSGQQKPLITKTINEQSRVMILGSKHPLAQPRFDIGSVNPDKKLDRMMLVLGASPQQEKDLQDFLKSQQDRTSANYHHWLTPEEFGQKFGPAPQDVTAVKGWLTAEGFTVESVAKSGRWIQFSGTAGQTEHAFSTIMRHYQVGQSTHLANASEISLPAAISPVVRGLVSLHDFFKKPMIHEFVRAQRNPDGSYTPITPNATIPTSSGTIHALTPGDFARIYQLNPLYTAAPTPLNGSGVTIAIVAREAAGEADFTAFRSIAGLTLGNLVQTATFPIDPKPDTSVGDQIEANLDAQWAGGVAPGATINVVFSSSTGTSDGVDLSAAYIVDHNLAPVMSVSFGDCEAALGPAENAFFKGLWQQAAAQGISVMVASGDSGAAGCDQLTQPVAATGGLAVSGLSSTPFNTAVGGTEFQDSTNIGLFWSSVNSSSGVSVNGYIPEAAWNESCNPNAPASPCAGSGFILASGGGGASALYPKPDWQNGITGVPSDAARDVPDISFSAAIHDGYVICAQNSCATNQIGVIGGTSASSPAFAGVMAIINQAAGRQGLANYKLYELAQNPSAFCDSNSRSNPSVAPPANCIFNDVTSGNNSVPGQIGFNAGPAFDLVSGLGSVNAANLVNAWNAIPLQTTTIAISSNGGATITGIHGQPVPLSVTVTGALATPAPAGNVALMSSANGGVGAVAVSGSVTGNKGIFDGTISNLPGGTYTLTGHYPGDGQFGSSDSNAIAVNISPEGSSVKMGTFNVDSAGAKIAASSFPYGGVMILHADVAGLSGQGDATGSVTFQEPSTAQLLGRADLNVKGEGEAFLLGGNTFPAALTVGTHTLAAHYLGDSSFGPSDSAPFAITITKGNAAVGPVQSQTDLAATASSNLVASLAPTGNITPTGTVQFFEDGEPIGSPATIDPRTDGAILQFSPVAAGDHTFTASYSGDGTYNPASSKSSDLFVSTPFVFLAPTPGSATGTLAAGQTGTFKLSLVPQPGITFSGSVALTCTSPSPAITCTVSPTALPVSAAAGGSLTLTISAAKNAELHQPHLRGWPLTLAGVAAIALAGFGKKQRLGLAVLVFLAALGMSSCGAGSSQSAPPPQTTPTNIIVTGTSGSYVATGGVQLTITH
jgi:hypothetical protein